MCISIISVQYQVSNVKEDYIQAKKKAFALLARREHSVEELKTKLSLKGYGERLLNDVLADLIHENYLSDERYVEMMFRYHFGRGQGPRKIISLIQQASVEGGLIQQIYQHFEGDWFQSAAHERQKKFGTWQGGLEEKRKQARFLLGRGFEFDHVKAAFTEQTCHKV